MAENTGPPVPPAPEPAVPTPQPAPASAVTPATPPSTPAPEKKPTTILESTDDVKPVAPVDWPDDWREKMAGTDEKFLKRLQRMKSPNEVAQWGRNAEKQWKQGADPDPFPTEGTDEEKAAWRKAKNVPVEPGEYLKDFSLPDGLVIGENDRPAVNEYLSVAHKMNLPPDVVRQNIGWYFKMRDGEIQKRMEKDAQDKAATAGELRTEMGADFNKYLGAAYVMLESAPEGVLDALTEARTRDGTKLGNHPQIVRWLSQLALELNPAATIVPGKGEGAMASVKSRMAEIEVVMGQDRNRYYREGMDKEYQKLVEVTERANKRSAA